MMIGTCGHQVDWPPVTSAIKAYCWGSHSIHYVVYCPHCVEGCRESGELLENKEAEDAWLAAGVEYDEPSPAPFKGLPTSDILYWFKRTKRETLHRHGT